MMMDGYLTDLTDVYDGYGRKSKYKPRVKTCSDLGFCKKR